MTYNYTTAPAPATCCPVCWHRRGRAISVNCKDHTIEEKNEIRKMEQTMIIGIIDIETTGFLTQGGKIVEIGIASLNIETGEILPTFGSVCREPGLTIKDRDAWIFANSTLTVDDVRNAPLLSDLHEEIQQHIGHFNAVTAYNKAFDFDYLRDRGFTIADEWPCPMLAATPVCKLPGKRTMSTGSQIGNAYKWPSVEECWRHLFPDRPYTELHRGLDDAMREAEIIRELHRLGHMEQ